MLKGGAGVGIGAGVVQGWESVYRGVLGIPLNENKLPQRDPNLAIFYYLA